jgi:hypothetical protein
MDAKQVEKDLADANELLSRASMARLAYIGSDGCRAPQDRPMPA